MNFLRVHEVHLPNLDHLPKKDYVALKYEETSSRRKEKMSFSKDLKVQMASSNNSYGDSIDDEMTLMSRKFKQMMKKKENTKRVNKRKTCLL